MKGDLQWPLSERQLKYGFSVGYHGYWHWIMAPKCSRVTLVLHHFAVFGAFWCHSGISPVSPLCFFGITMVQHQCYCDKAWCNYSVSVGYLWNNILRAVFRKRSPWVTRAFTGHRKSKLVMHTGHFVFAVLNKYKDLTGLVENMLFLVPRLDMWNLFFTYLLWSFFGETITTFRPLIKRPWSHDDDACVATTQETVSDRFSKKCSKVRKKQISHV